MLNSNEKSIFRTFNIFYINENAMLKRTIILSIYLKINFIILQIKFSKPNPFDKIMKFEINCPKINNLTNNYLYKFVNKSNFINNNFYIDCIQTRIFRWLLTSQSKIQKTSSFSDDQSLNTYPLA